MSSLLLRTDSSLAVFVLGLYENTLKRDMDVVSLEDGMTHLTVRVCHEKVRQSQTFFADKQYSIVFKIF